VLWQSGPLPSAYQQVEYVQAAANVGAYINLGFTYDTGATIYLGQWISGGATAYPFGARDSSNASRCMFSSPYSYACHPYYVSDSGETSLSVGYTNNALNEFIATYKVGDIRCKNLTNGAEAAKTNIIAYKMSCDLYLFAQNYNGSPRFGAIRRIHYFKYYDKNDTLICDLVPCYRKSDGVIGMYDLVRKIFLTNVGTGSFTKGADV
jgi:hypothetical protein